MNTKQLNLHPSNNKVNSFLSGIIIAMLTGFAIMFFEAKKNLDEKTDRLNSTLQDMQIELTIHNQEIKSMKKVVESNEESIKEVRKSLARMAMEQ